MSYLVENPEDRFSRDEAHIKIVIFIEMKDFIIHSTFLSF